MDQADKGGGDDGEGWGAIVADVERVAARNGEVAWGPIWKRLATVIAGSAIERERCAAWVREQAVRGTVCQPHAWLMVIACMELTDTGLLQEILQAESLQSAVRADDRLRRLALWPLWRGRHWDLAWSLVVEPAREIEFWIERARDELEIAKKRGPAVTGAEPEIAILGNCAGLLCMCEQAGGAAAGEMARGRLRGGPVRAHYAAVVALAERMKRGEG